MDEVKRWHWFHYVMMAVRTIWLGFGIFDFTNNPGRVVPENHLFPMISDTGLVLLWYTAAYLVPIVLFVIPKVPRIYSIAADLVLCGGLFLYLSIDLQRAMSFYFFPVFMLGYMSSGRTVIGTGAAALALPLLTCWIWGYSWIRVADNMIDFLIQYGIGYCISRLINALQRIKDMYGIIQKQNHTLEINAKQIEKLTLLEERSRLSRELHDTIGHTFTTTITGMDAVYYLIDADPQEAKNNLRELLHYTRNGLDDVRGHIHNMAPEQGGETLPLSLRHISEQFAEHTGIQLHFETEGEEVHVSESLRMTLIRFLQEALTNAVRHGRASDIQVRLRFSSREVCLSVRDNGEGNKKLVKGFGLQGISQRLANLNGTLHIQSSPDQGTTLKGTIPLRL